MVRLTDAQREAWCGKGNPGEEAGLETRGLEAFYLQAEDSVREEKASGPGRISNLFVLFLRQSFAI